MKKLLAVLILFTAISYSQSQRNKDEMETLKALNQLMESNAISELEAQKTVLNYYLDTKKELRRNYSELDENEKIELDRQQKFLWSAVQEVINMYKNYKGYKGFLREQYQILTHYNESVYDLFYFLVDNDLSNSQKFEDFKALSAEKYFSFVVNPPKN